MSPRLSRFLFILTIAGLLIIAPVTATTPKNVLIIDIPRLMYSDVTSDYPTLNRLLNTSAVGIMALPNLEPKTLDKTYLELNSGNPLKTLPDELSFYQVNEDYNGMPAGKLYRTLTGFKPPKSGAVNLGFSKLVQLNSPNGYQSIGLFGNILHQKGYRTVVAGNADMDHQTLNRYGTVLLMDEKGTVDVASIGWETVTEDIKFVFGVKTATPMLLKFWESYRNDAVVGQLILGDLERINKFSSYLPSSRLEFHRHQVLSYYDAFFKELLPKLDFNRTLLIVFSVAGPDDAKTGAKLSPILLKSSNFRQGHLYSNSTRRPGLITGYDMMVTILDHLGISKKSGYFKGRPLKTVLGKWADVGATQTLLTVNYDVRWPLLTVYGYSLILLVGAFGVGMIWFRGKTVFFQVLARVYLFLLTIPVVFLVEALINPVDWLTIIAFTLLTASVITWIVWKMAGGNLSKALMFICALTVGSVIIDGISNGFAELYSFWGYSAVAGARFYGIGNEYMGFLLGAYIVLITLLFNKIPEQWRKALWPLGLMIAILLAHPAMGANIGGGVTALIGLGITNFLWMKRPVGLRQILILAGVFTVFILAIAFSDLSMNGRVTHFGQFLKVFQEEGFPAFAQLVSRKLEMNLEIINYTPLSKVLIGMLLIVPVLYKNPPKAIAGWCIRYQQPLRGFMGLSITALVALLANDSGIVSVATMFIFGLNFLMLLIVNEISL